MANTISVTPGFIGTKSDRTNLLTYSITGTMGTITEVINGTTVNTHASPTSGQSFTVSLTQAQWDAIKYGKYKDVTGGLNTLTVSMGSDVFTYTFDKRLATTDDLLSAVKSVQDANGTYLPAVKSKLGSAIRGKGGTVNDTDSWDTMVSAVTGMTTKKWASGAGTLVTHNANVCKLTVTGLAFKPSYVIMVRTATYNANTVAHSFPNSSTIDQWSTSGGTNFSLGGDFDSTFLLTSDGFTLPSMGANISTVSWIAYE